MVESIKHFFFGGGGLEKCVCATFKINGTWFDILLLLSTQSYILIVGPRYESQVGWLDSHIVLCRD